MPLVHFKQLRGAIVTLLALSFFIVPAGVAAGTQPGANLRKPGWVVTPTIVNLSALLGASVRFVPTALNGKGQIVGYDDRTLSNGNAGSAYLINPDGTFGALDGTGTTPAFFIPLAISANGNSVAGVANGATSYLPSGPAVWRLLGGARSHQIYRHYPGATERYLLRVTGIANGNVPVAGTVFYGSSGYSVTPFKTSGCALSNFSANAANDAGTIVGTAGGYGATATLSGCATYLPNLPRPANASTSAIAENASGALIVAFQGPAAPAFGAYYLVVKSRYARVPLPPAFSAATYFVQAVALSDSNAVVGNVSAQAPPFAPVAPFLYANGRSTDVNTLLPAKSGWRLVTAAGIDSAGEIIGTGYYHGVLQGYALRP